MDGWLEGEGRGVGGLGRWKGVIGWSLTETYVHALMQGLQRPVEVLSPSSNNLSNFVYQVLAHTHSRSFICTHRSFCLTL